MNTIIHSNKVYTILDISTPTFSHKFTLIDTEDLELVSKYHWGVGARGEYLFIYSYAEGKRIYLSRLLMRCPTEKVVDHINGNTFINSKINLRVCSRKENARNQNSFNQRKGKYKGVRKLREGGGFSARIKVDGKEIHLGTFLTAERAAQVYNTTAKLFFGEFANPNVIKEKINGK